MKLKAGLADRRGFQRYRGLPRVWSVAYSRPWGGGGGVGREMRLER